MNSIGSICECISSYFLSQDVFFINMPGGIVSVTELTPVGEHIFQGTNVELGICFRSYIYERALFIFS